MRTVVTWTVLLAGLFCACGPALDEAPTAGGDRLVEEIPVTTDSEAALAAFEEGLAKLDAGRAEEANALFGRAVEQDPAFAYAHLNIANSSASAVEFKTHLDLATESLEGKSEGERLLVEIVRTFLDNDAERRLELTRELTEAYPSSSRAWLTRGRMQTTLNQHQAARESFARALELQPDLVAGHRALGYSYVFNEPKDFDRAREEMEMAIQLAPDEAKTHEALGDVYRAMNELERARESYSRALEIDSELSVAALKKGHINSFLGNFDEARADYDAGIADAQGANRPNYANYRTFTWLHAGDPDAALAALADLAESIDHMGLPDDQVRAATLFTLSNAAAVALHFDRLEAAERILARREEVAQISADTVGDPDYSRRVEAELVLWRGRLAAVAGDLDHARDLADRNRELLQGGSNPRRFEGHHGLLGRIALETGEFDEAVEQFQRADLTVTYVKYHLALALEGAGEAERARELFREVAEYNFNSVGFAMVRREAMERAS